MFSNANDSSLGFYNIVTQTGDWVAGEWFQAGMLANAELVVVHLGRWAGLNKETMRCAGRIVFS